MDKDVIYFIVTAVVFLIVGIKLGFWLSKPLEENDKCNCDDANHCIKDCIAKQNFRNYHE